MKTVGEARVWLKEKLNSIYAEDELPEIVFLIMNFVTGISQTQLHVFPNKELTKEQIEMLLLTEKKLQTGMPIQYALGEADFFGLKFKVNPSVLIPRPETEELVAWILKERRSEEQREKSERILDIGTGSGCIPIAIKKNWSKAEVFGLDISIEALLIAKQNALLNQVEVQFFQQDILDFYPVKEVSKYSIIVSNPPYITPFEQELMQTNVLDFEPHQALFVPESDPLLFYRAIADYASFMLEKSGLLFFEINEKYGQETVELLQEKDFTEIELRKDFRGKNRMIRAKKFNFYID